jgi:hypothetical protein
MADLVTLAERDARLAALTDAQTVWMALACAERLAAADTAARGHVQREALDTAWNELTATHTELLGVLVESLEARDDVDDDPVATVVYALQAVAGVPGAARWAAQRCIDAAFERVSYPPGVTTFRSLHEDAAADVVKEELQWQIAIAEYLTRATTVEEVREWVRQQFAGSGVDLTDALVVYVGHGYSPFPDFRAERLQEIFGSAIALDLLPQLDDLADDFYAYKRRSSDQFTDAQEAAKRFSQRHPQIRKEAVDALAWAYAFDNR